MTIIKPPDNEDPKVIEKELAITGCEICPCCKKKNTTMFSRRIKHIYEYKYWIEEYYTQNYTCPNCGCEYQSEPYWYSALPQDDTDATILFVMSLVAISFSFAFVLPHKLLLRVISIIFCLYRIYKLYRILNEYKKHYGFDKEKTDENT